jgi:hypothetical protein
VDTYPRVFVEYRYLIRIQYGYVSVLEYPGFIAQIQSNIIVEEKMPQLNGATAAGPVPFWRFLLPSSHYHILCVIDMLLSPLNQSVNPLLQIHGQYTILITCLL